MSPSLRITSLRLACKKEDLLELSLVPLHSIGKNSHSGPSSLRLSAEYRLGQDSMPVLAMNGPIALDAGETARTQKLPLGSCPSF